MKMKGFTGGIVVLMVLMALAVAGLAWSAAGDSLLKFRYDIDSTVDELNYSQDLNSNIQDQLDAITAGGDLSLADTKVNVGNSGGIGVAQSISLTNDVTGSLGNSGEMVTTIPASTINASMIAANAVGASEANRIVNTLVIATASTSNGIGNNVLYNASGYMLTPKNNANGNQFIANSTMDVNGNVVVFLNGTADDDYTLEVIRWAP